MTTKSVLPAAVERLVDVCLLAGANDADKPDYETAMGQVYSDFMGDLGRQAGSRAHIAALGSWRPLEDGLSAAGALFGEALGVEIAYAAMIIDGLSRLHAQTTGRTPADVLRDVIDGLTSTKETEL